MSEVTNLQRTVWAEAALTTFREATRCDLEDALGDLLCDLMHWAVFSKYDFEAALDRARDHFQQEVDECR